MKIGKLASSMLALALALTLGACGGPSTYSQEVLTEASGIKVTAENGKSGDEALTKGAITVKEGDVIVISPFTEKGSFHLTITSSEGEVIYDDDASGKVLYTIGAAPGTYDVKTSGNNVTGWMTVAAQSSADLIAQDEALADALSEQEGDIVEKIESLNAEAGEQAEEAGEAPDAE
ncbi:MAG: hypothetical protein J6D34_00115 [Atopobiaceae bacterium]|nr:hypothetical protein [Atopobiaceae bacterium]